jgi:hypothetical protein
LPTERVGAVCSIWMRHGFILHRKNTSPRGPGGCGWRSSGK